MTTAKARFRAIAAALVLGTASLAATPVAAQSNDEARIKQLEAEVRALQRKVFPNGAGRTFAPEINPAVGAAGAVPPPATSAMTDILGRLDAIENQLARLTAQTEENTNGLSQLTLRVDKLEAAQAAAVAPPPVDAAAGAPEGAAAPPKVGPVEPATPSRELPPAKAKEPAKPTAARIAAVEKIVKPQTDDAANDEYVYGFRLWQAGFYPEAEQQLRLFVDKYPSSAQISYGRNLLGRAYLDDGKPTDAASWFLKNYQADKDGARAPDSLLYLSETMMALKDDKKACIALAEFARVYTAVATGRLSDQYEADRKKVTCN